ncbi:hypothetical protein Dda_7029 [Drechslerella dactyloides]|uniref:Uncharacterized protein n=1 Tax=Drechslerella dactyloides TaxID=74499 RepID=A0AAD6NH64_DREDA|nr:hypothetical protein Dda_7029 [Drechslerella dactyloides]
MSNTFARETNRPLFYFLGFHECELPVDNPYFLTVGDSSEGVDGLGIFPFVKGMPIIMNDSEHRALRITNGMQGTAVDFIPDPESDFLKVGHQTYIITCLPIVILGSFDVADHQQFDKLEHGIILIFLKKRFMVESKLTMEWADRLQSPVNSVLKFKRTQVPCRAAFAMTVNKAQGQTYANAVIDLHATNKNISEADTFQATYVALSRVKSGAGLYFLRETPSDIFRCKAHNILKNDESRFENLETNTLSATDQLVLHLA